MLRTLGAAVVLAFAMLIVLRPIVFGTGWSAVDLFVTATVLIAAGLILRRQTGIAASMGRLLLVFGIALLGLAITVLAFAVLSCCS